MHELTEKLSKAIPLAYSDVADKIITEYILNPNPSKSLKDKFEEAYCSLSDVDLDNLVKIATEHFET